MVSACGYQCLLLEIDGCSPHRRLYIKRHSKSETDLGPEAAALFVAGIPVKLEECLEDVFGAFGAVKQVQLHPRRTSAVVVFALEKTVSNVLAAAKKEALITFTTNISDQQPMGLRKYVDLHKARYPGNQKLQQELNSWMEAFETAESERKRAAEESAADDGWTVVTRKPGRKRKNEEYASSKKSKLALDFYRFQAREQKRSELVELQNQFAAAKKQVHALRANRKFQA